MKATIGPQWKTLISKLHPPLPMSPKESARLLALLNASFKQQLNGRNAASLPDTEHHSDLHLRSILTNPLFNRQSSLREGRNGRKPFGLVQDLLKRPMDVFLEQVATGSATPETARFCLKAQYRNCLVSPDADLSVAMKDSRAGSTVMNWLWSSGLEESGEFFKDHDLIALLIKFLITESYHDRIWQWLHKLHSKARQTKSPADYRNYKHLLIQYLESEVSSGKGLESAVALFVRISQDAQQKTGGDKKLSGILNSVAFQLTFKLMNISKTEKLQIHTLDPFIEAAKTCCARRVSCLIAFHEMYLAKDPNPNPALDYFRTLSAHYMNKLVPSRRPRIVLLGLKAAEMFLDQGRQAEAIAIMDILQDKFSDDIGWHAYQKIENLERNPGGSEERSIRLLDTLAIA